VEEALATNCKRTVLHDEWMKLFGPKKIGSKGIFDNAT
jgi:hypothetical protein